VCWGCVGKKNEVVLRWAAVYSLSLTNTPALVSESLLLTPSQERKKNEKMKKKRKKERKTQSRVKTKRDDKNKVEEEKRREEKKGTSFPFSIRIHKKPP